MRRARPARSLPPGIAATDTAPALRDAGVLALPLDASTLRFVVHARVGDEAVARAAAATAQALDPMSRTVA